MLDLVSFFGLEFMMEFHLFSSSIPKHFTIYVGVILNSVVLGVKYPNGIVFL